MKELSEKVVAGGFALALLLLCGVGVESYLSVNRLVESRRWVDHTHYVLDTLNQIPEGMEEADRGRRGYFVLKSDKGLNVLQAGVQKTKQAVVEVRQLTSDNAEQQHRLSEVEPLIVQRLALFEHFVDLVRQNKLKPTDRDATLRQNLFLQQKIQLGLQAVEQTERSLLQQRSDDIDRAVQQGVVAAGIGYSSSFCLLAGVFFLLQREIRSRKQAEIALQKHAEEVYDLYNYAPCGYHSLDIAGTFIRINETELDWLGYTREEVIHKKTFLELTTSHSAQVFQESFPIFKEQGWISDLEFELVRKDGTILPVSLSATTIRNAKGDFVMSRSTLFDISDRKRAQAELQHANEQLEARVQARTAELSQVNALLRSELIERKQAEHALSESEKQLRLITDALPVLISYIDANQRFRFNNRAYEPWFGYDWTKLQGRHLKDVLGELAYQTIKPYVEAVLSGQEVSYESSVPYKEGGIRWVSAIYIPDFGEQGAVKGYFALVSDITDRKQAEQALAESEKQLRLITDALPVLISYVDADQHYRFNNKAYEQWNGRKRAEITGQSLKQVLGETAYQLIQPRVETVLSGQAVTYESRIPYGNGTRWIDATYMPDFGEQGTVKGFFALVTDITDRKRAEEALRESKERLAFALQTAEMGDWELNLNDRTMQRSPRHDQIFGYDCLQNEWTYEQFLSYVLPDDRATVKAKFGAALVKAEIWDFECRIRRLDGALRWVWGRGHLYQDAQGDTVRMLGLIADITDRKQAEEALRESEQRLNLAIEGSGMATWDTNLKTGQALWSAQHFTVLGYEPVPTGEATLSMWQRCIYPDDQELVLQTAGQAIQTRSPYRLEHRIQRADNGQTVWLAAFGRVLYDEAGQAVRFIGIILDISDRKCAELALQEAKDGLEVQVQERTAALKQSNDDLHRSNQELEQFAYVASHDLQEPLRAIMGYTQLLTQDYRDRLDETAQGYGAYIVEGAQRMQQLIQDLLHYSRAGTRDLDFAPTDCNNVLEQVLGNLQVAIAESHASITYDPLPTVIADKGQLAQLLQNLIGNAIKFCREESPQVHISAKQDEEQTDITSTPVRLSAHVEAHVEAYTRSAEHTSKPHPIPHTPPTTVWLFSIHDNGIGIKPRYLERIFEIFKRLHTRTEFPGTGIGLAICKKIVDRHSGRIWAESEPGNGTTFYFTIPYDDASDL